MEENINELIEKAQNGNTDAQYKLGMIYEQGDGIEKDYKKAFYWYKKACDQEFIEALQKYPSAKDEKEKDQKQEKNELDFKDFITEARELAKSYFALMIMELDDELKTKYGQRYKEWYEKAAEKGDAESLYELGTIYEHGEVVEKDFQKAMNYYEKSAEKQFAQAQFKLGFFYFEGDIIAQDYIKAKYYFEAASKQNNAGALYGLGLMYENGFSVKKDLHLAENYYKLAAKEGYCDAFYKLGLYSFIGVIEDRDFVKAKFWWEKASDPAFLSSISGVYFSAEYCLSCMYLYGIGVDKDIEKSEKLYNDCRESLEPDIKSYIDDIFSEVL